MGNKKYAVLDYITADVVKRVRKKVNLTQKEFAGFIGVSKPTIERWETGKSKITGPVVLLLQILDEHPEYIDSFFIPPKKYPLRLYYMYKEKICTIIDVDDNNRQVQIYNYTKQVMFRAFGNELNPTYEEYIDFLKSRTFPETRDKLKLVLKDLDLPFYDTFMIIEKTNGKMAEDDFWIRIER